MQPAFPQARAALACLLMTSALVSITGLAASADSGTPCVLLGLPTLGKACSIATTGAPATGADGTGGSGGPGNPAAAISTTLDTEVTYEDYVSPYTADYTAAVNVTAIGSDGARGNSGDRNSPTGGNGGTGGAGGAVTLGIGGAVSGAAVNSPVSGTASGVTVGSGGGNGGGGAGGAANGGTNGNSGTGGRGGDIDVTADGTFTSAYGLGADIWSQGGNGGDGPSETDFDNKYGGDGGKGGVGGSVTAVIQGRYQGQTIGVHVVSAGGDGGKGGDGDSDASGQGGNGGNAGDGGAVSATLAERGAIYGYGSNAAGLWVQSLGGSGGQGGGGEDGGDGGRGGNANTVVVEVDGTITTAVGSASPGVLAQSLGNVGGGGGHASDWSFNPTGGDGDSGGGANTVTVTGTGAKIQTGLTAGDSDTAPGVLAQSIGGFGGIGSSAKGWFSVGGSGGGGSDGQAVSVALTGSTVATFGSGSSGLVAQSIGGGGGAGGDANGSGTLVNMVIGGTGASAGAGHLAYAANLGNGTITTAGDHASGVVMQSIGGGGGSGGSAYGKSDSVLYGASISVGGKGGAGGNGGAVGTAQAENNAGTIQTTGNESYGIRGQSIGGGGGSGGASTAKSSVLSGGEFPGLSLTLSTGGSGASGGDAGTVYLQNSGLIATSGLGSVGILGQAVGGGGGSGGDATAASTANGGGFSLQAKVAHGGAAGAGGHGGDITTVNHGFIATTGESADGMLVQSVGGGGGSGGAGDSMASSKADKSVALELSIGGTSGAGGQGYGVTAENTGSILTLGDGANGIAAQTIGGGGGRGGGAAVSSSATISLTAAVGGSGGNGGDTWTHGSNSAVTNSGTVVTYGADAAGILAQSIGGGGGAGGKGATSMGSDTSNNDGSNGEASRVLTTISGIVDHVAEAGTDALADYVGLGPVVDVSNNLLGLVTSSGLGSESPSDQLDSTAAASGRQIDVNNPKSIAFKVAVGGSGGGGGAGGVMTVTNSGTVATMGHQSDGIVVQSVGGGGGKGGAASTATSTNISGSIGIGGTGGSGSSSNGGLARVSNSGEVYTTGVLANGIVAQSIGSGGGIGGTSAATSAGDSGRREIALSQSLGGSAGSTGISEAAQVQSSGAIETRGHDSYGIIAQSVSGGGGILKTLASDLDNQSGSANGASLSKDFDTNFTFGPLVVNNKALSSGAALVNTAPGGTIVTHGDNGIGILAQSVAGGGGLALGGKPKGSYGGNFFGNQTKSGTVNPGLSSDPGDNHGVIVEVGDDITTYGKGGVGVFAQSVGGGGGIAGDIGSTMAKTNFRRDLGAAYNGDFNGNGGDISVTVDPGARIVTSGDNAPAIIAQTVGGGGGWITNEGGAFIGSTGGTGNGGIVFADIDGAVITTGASSAGVFAQSTGGEDNSGGQGPNGGTGSSVQVNIGASGSITVGQPGQPTPANGDGAAIYIANGGRTDDEKANMVVNDGTVQTYGSVRNAVAVYSTGGFTRVTNNGTMNGDVLLANGGGSGCFTNNGHYGGGDTVSVGDCPVINTGTIEVGSVGTVSALTIQGDYEGSGRLALDADFARGTSDRLVVTGTAKFADEVKVASKTLVPSTVTIATAAKIAPDATLSDVTGAHLFDFTPRIGDGIVTITPKADFALDGFGGDRGSLARHLQRVWDGDHPEALAQGFARLAAVGDASGYADALDSLSSRQVGALATARADASRGFVSNMQSCPGFVGESLLMHETNCAWGRVVTGKLDNQGSGTAEGFDADSTTTQFGGQRAIDDAFFVTGSVAYSNARVHGDDGRSSASGDVWMAGLGVKYQQGPLLASLTADLGTGSFDSSRSFVLGGESFTAKGSPDSSNIGLHGRISYQLPYEGFYLRPSLDLAATWVKLDGYDESGAGDFDLSVAGSSNWILSASPAFEVGARLDLEGGVTLRPFAAVGASFLSGNDWEVKSRFRTADPDDGSFTSSVDNPSALGTFRAGIALMTSPNFELTAQYDASFADGFSSQAGAFKAVWRF